ncbi:MAG: NAD-dependent epimerase/dehydratase family protein [Bacteroidota bacterium]
MNKLNKPVILVTGACGQIGTELCAALRKKYGSSAVIATDRMAASGQMQREGPYCQLDVLKKYDLEKRVMASGVTQIYHLAAMLSATGEQQPQQAWEVNMQGLLHVLEVAREQQVCQVFWPSSIAVFGEHALPACCPQHSVTEPATIYGISKHAGELWCKYYFDNYGLDVRSIRYPGLISHTAQPGGGTTDYAVDIFHQALKTRTYTCFLKESTTLPMLYMPDAIRATLELMAAPAESLSVRTGYNLWGMSFSPKELAEQICRYLPVFQINYQPDARQRIADSWPTGIDDRLARRDWGWKEQYDLPAMVADMLYNLGDSDLKRVIGQGQKEKEAAFVGSPG